MSKLRQVVKHLVLDHGQQDCSATKLEKRCNLSHVGIASDDMKPAVLHGVCVGFISSIDDRTLERGLQTNFLFKKVGPLRQLEWNGISTNPGHLCADFARASENLPGDKMCRCVQHN